MKKKILAIGLILILGGVIMVSQFLPSAPKTVADINANPQILNGLTFRKGDLEGLNVKNVHIKGMVFDDIQAENSIFVNVTFEDCTFTKVNFQYCRFENVAFKNCTLQNSGDIEDIRNTTILRYSDFKNVLFENTKLHHPVIDGIDGLGGYIYFKKMADVIPRGGKAALITGTNIHLRIVDSDLKAAALLVDDEENFASFMAKNSKFANHHLRSNIIYIESCILKTGGVVARKDLVIKNSVVANTGAYMQNTGYLAANTYPNFEKSRPSPTYKNASYHSSSKVVAQKGGAAYVIDSGSELAYITPVSGNITIQDTVLAQSLFWSEHPEDPLVSLNLKNVKILGGIWRRVLIEQGKWENVTIEPVILIDRANLTNIQAYNLQYPKGEPWRKEGEFTFDVTTVDKPFEWEEIHVPTPEELGLEWWPSEPGYHPDKNS